MSLPSLKVTHPRLHITYREKKKIDTLAPMAVHDLMSLVLQSLLFVSCASVEMHHLISPNSLRGVITDTSDLWCKAWILALNRVWFRAWYPH